MNRADDHDDSARFRWTTVATFNTSAEAHVARLALESNGIDCFIADENVGVTAWHYSIATGGIKLQVDAADVESATALLATRADAADDTQAPHIDDNNHCPQCGSTRITRDGFTRRRIVALAFLTAITVTAHWVLAGVLLSVCVLLILRSTGHRCLDCNHTWDLRRGFTIVPTAKPAPAATDARPH